MIKRHSYRTQGTSHADHPCIRARHLMVLPHCFGQVIGNFIEFGKDQTGFIYNMSRKYGPAFSMGMMGQNLTFLVGPDVSAAFFAAKDEELSQPEVYGFMKPVFGDNVVYDAPPKLRKQQMAHMTKGLAVDRLKSYVPKIVAETEAFFKRTWGEKGEVDILQVRERGVVRCTALLRRGYAIRRARSNAAACTPIRGVPSRRGLGSRV